MAPDVEAARAFYGAVLGWSFAETGDEYGGYVISQVDGAAAAGIGPQQPGAPAAWTLYFASDDADATASRTAELGGTVLLPPGDVGPLGRMFVGTDPSGAPFGVWQAGEHIGAGIANEPGAMTWEDLRTTDPEAARAFFGELFGFRFEEVPEAGDGADYRIMFRPGEDAPLGGVGGMLGAPGPPHWLVYFGVADTPAAAAAAERTGGTVVVPPFATPFGRQAVLADPGGATFSVIETDGSNQPDRSG
jgi:predicted enzyme related to lactoylglutathione lyase